VLVCTGSRPERHQDLIDRFELPTTVFAVSGEPTIDVARAAAEAAREQLADLVVAIGGGSVLDVGKAVAMLLGNGGDPLDYLEIVGRGKPITKPSVCPISRHRPPQEPAPRSPRTPFSRLPRMGGRRACAAASCCRQLPSSIPCSR
jgi:Iron-containing alcohol dehydrogenase